MHRGKRVGQSVLSFESAIATYRAGAGALPLQASGSLQEKAEDDDRTCLLPPGFEKTSARTTPALLRFDSKHDALL